MVTPTTAPSSPTTPIDPAVRSVRVALALAERFLELLSGPTSSQDLTGMELRIGEAQQIYPEIWGHLDDARTAFAARGIDVTGYDQLRAGEKGILGVTNLDLVTVDVGRHQAQYRTATFNTDGYRSARAAANALMAAVPDVDWVAIAKAETAEAQSIGSLTQGRWLKLAIGLAVAVILLYLLVKKA